MQATTRRAATIAELSAYVRRINAATTCAQVGAVYLDMVGYALDAEQPDIWLEELQAEALDYVREVCFAEGIHTSRVGLAFEQIVDFAAAA